MAMVFGVNLDVAKDALWEYLLAGGMDEGEANTVVDGWMKEVMGTLNDIDETPIKYLAARGVGVVVAEAIFGVRVGDGQLMDSNARTLYRDLMVQLAMQGLAELSFLYSRRAIGRLKGDLLAPDGEHSTDELRNKYLKAMEQLRVVTASAIGG